MSRGSERWPGFLCSALLVSALASCDPPPQFAFDSLPFIGTIYRSQVFEYHTRDSQPLCPTLLALMDRHAKLIGAKLGFSLAPGDPLIPYYRFDNEADFQASGVCPPGAGGCADSAVYSPLSFHAHEMAHAYTFRAWGSAPVGLLAEGEAVALSCDPPIWDPNAPSPPLIETPYLGDWRPLLLLSGDNLSSLGGDRPPPRLIFEPAR